MTRRPRAGRARAAAAEAGVDAGASRDAGTSLAELILSVLILGTATVTILGAFATLIRTSDFTRKLGDASGTIAAVAEAVADNTRNPYNTSCNPVYDLSSVTFPTGVSATIESVKYWNGAAGEFVTSPCSDATVPAWRLQLVEIKVTANVRSGDGTVERTISVVKRG